MHQIARIGFKMKNFLHFRGGTSPSDTPCTHPTGAEVLLVLNLGTQKSWIRPCRSSGAEVVLVLDLGAPLIKKNPGSVPAFQAVSRATGEIFRGAELTGGGGWGWDYSTLLQGAKINDLLSPPPGVGDLLDTPLRSINQSQSWNKLIIIYIIQDWMWMND